MTIIGATGITVNPVWDLYIDEDNPNTNYGSTGVLTLGVATKTSPPSTRKFILMKFTLDNLNFPSFPSASKKDLKVIGMELKLHVFSSTSVAVEDTITVNTLSKDGLYGTDAVTADATWNTFDGDLNNGTWYGGTGFGPVNGIYDYISAGQYTTPSLANTGATSILSPNGATSIGSIEMFETPAERWRTRTNDWYVRIATNNDVQDIKVYSVDDSDASRWPELTVFWSGSWGDGVSIYYNSKIRDYK